MSDLKNSEEPEVAGKLSNVKLPPIQGASMNKVDLDTINLEVSEKDMSLIDFSEIELIKLSMTNEEHKTLTSADGNNKNQQSQIYDQDDAAGDADAVIQEEAGAKDEAVTEAVADCVEKDWFENGHNIKTFQQWKDEKKL